MLVTSTWKPEILLKSTAIEINYISRQEMDALRDRFNLDHDPSVLSFPKSKNFRYPNNFTPLLGEVFLCSYYAKKEARLYRVAYKDHEARLISHGVLHLLGYDHVRSNDAKKMERLEKKSLVKHNRESRGGN